MVAYNQGRVLKCGKPRKCLITKGNEHALEMIVHNVRRLGYYEETNDWQLRTTIVRENDSYMFMCDDLIAEIRDTEITSSDSDRTIR